jgi:CubicO group peptidase (beta-lactamase class C family)
MVTLVHAEPMTTLHGELEKELDKYIQLQKSPGISAAISLDDSVVYSGQAGSSNLELGAETSADSVFRMGSLTKQFTAAAIMKLQEKKLLNISDSILDHLTGIPSSWRTVKIAHLLNHTSGIPSYTDFPSDISRRDGSIEHKDVIDIIRNKDIEFNPGDKWHYSNSNYYLLGMIIEKVSGKSYDKFLIEDLLNALSPHSISYCYTDKLIKNRASGYAKEQSADNSVIWKNSIFINMLMPYSAGGLCATSVDLIRWNLALSSGQIISQASYEAMIINRKLNDGSLTNYGYGLGITRDEAGAVITHAGGIPGFRSSLVYYPEKKLGIAVLVNAENEDPSKINKILTTRMLEKIAGANPKQGRSTKK